MDLQVTAQEEQYKKKGLIISIVVHIFFLILLFIPFLTYPDPPPGQKGITVNLGIPEFDNFEDAAPAAPNTEPEPAPEKPTTEPEPQTRPERSEPIQEEVVQTEDPEAIALRKEQERKERERQEQLRKEQEEAERRRQAEEKRRRREAEAQENKEKFSDLFKNSGSGSDNDPAGGDPDGKPNSGALDKVTTSAGTVTGDLAGRGRPISSPKIEDDSQKTGRVAIKVCVDANGNVTEAKYTQLGSTTGDPTLKSKAIANAKKWKFPQGSKTDCGTITYEFKVR